MEDPIAISDWEAAWAQVSILLDLGNRDDATVAAERASGLADWDEAFGDSVNVGSPRIYGTPWIPAGWLWVQPQRRRCLMAESTLSRFAMRSSMFRFASSVRHAPGWHAFDEKAWASLDAKLRRRFNR